MVTENPFSVADLPVESIQIEQTQPAKTTSSIPCSSNTCSRLVFTKAFSPCLPGISIMFLNWVILSMVLEPYIFALKSPTSFIVDKIPIGLTSSL